MNDQQPSPPGWGNQPPPPQQPNPPNWGNQLPPPQQPSPPGWGYQPPPPKQPGKSHRGRNIALGVIGVLVLLVIIGSLGGGGDKTAAPDGPAATSAEPATNTPATEEETATSGSNVPETVSLGETVQFEDSFGNHAVDVTVVRGKNSTGGEFDKPSHGLYVGFLIRVKAFRDGMSVPDFYVLEGTRHYDSTVAASGFDPDLNRVFELTLARTMKAGWSSTCQPAMAGWS